MFKVMFRVLFGFALACLVAGLVTVMFVIGPQEMVSGGPEHLAIVLETVALTATYTAVFALSFALLWAAVSEWQAVRGFFFHVMAGVGTALAGYGTLYFGRAPTDGDILNNYAATAYVVIGFAGGFVYWLFVGRHAGSAPDFYEPSSNLPAKFQSET